MNRMLNQYADYLRVHGQGSKVKSYLLLGEHITERFGTADMAPLSGDNVDRLLELGRTVAAWNGFETAEMI